MPNDGPNDGPNHGLGDWIDDVIRFWFEELGSEVWFSRNDRVDAAIRERFAGLYEQIRTLGLLELSTPQACVAAVIVLDQFPRNMFRSSPHAYATDARALAIAECAIAAGFDLQLSDKQRLFLYMPFQHSESLAVQARSIELFTALGDAEVLDYAVRHKEVIDRFGRFPHRNVVLGRESSPEELLFLKSHPGF